MESDRGRIVHLPLPCVVFRQKTQVFPLERNAALCSRLTHSLEVQQTGRFIVRTLFRQLARVPRRPAWTGWKAHGKAWWKWPAWMHDVGNPPFGHFGEYAINDWFERNLDALFERRHRRARATACCSSACSPTSSTSKATPKAIRLVVKSCCA
ncbi:HD domain-containing protein [Pseudomonas aeruginosa]|nr:HD domain-containing protein [Pseudomonas aeruginosa]